MTQTSVPLTLAILSLDVSTPPSVVMTKTFVPKIGAHRTLVASIPLFLVTIAINVIPKRAIPSEDVNTSLFLVTITMPVLLILVILTLVVFTVSLTVTTAILVPTTLATRFKDANTPQLYVEMVISVL
jgi:hypothetical protein